MKKGIFGIMLFLALGATTQLSAQNITGGIKADANLSNFIVSDMPSTSSDMGFGATLGGFVKFDLGNHFAIQPELLFHYQNSTTKVATVKNDFQYFGAEIPVYAMGQWYTNCGDRFFVGVGPYVGFGFDARYTNGDVNLYDTDVLQPWDFGAKATIGYEFAGGLQISAGYKIGFINAVDKGTGTMLPETISLGLGYRF